MCDKVRYLVQGKKKGGRLKCCDKKDKCGKTLTKDFGFDPDTTVCSTDCGKDCVKEAKYGLPHVYCSFGGDNPFSPDLPICEELVHTFSHPGSAGCPMNGPVCCAHGKDHGDFPWQLCKANHYS